MVRGLLDLFGDPRMRRFFFDLFGPMPVEDEHGLLFGDLTVAARAAEMLAKDLSEIRHELRGSTSVVVTENRNEFTYCIAVH